MTSREKFEAFLVSEYEWGNDALNAANFHGDDATGYYTGGDFICDWQSCSEGLFWAWRGWQAAELASEQKLTDQAVQLANAESKCRELAAAENNLIDSECHVAELDESLRDKQELLDALDNALCELLPGTQYIDPPDGGSVTPLEQVRRMVADYRERIANLELRKVCVPRISNDEFWLSFNNRIVFREETYRSAIIKVIDAAGIGVKGE